MSFEVLLFWLLFYDPMGVIRHGINKEKSLELANRPEYACVGMFTQENRIKGSCVLIHPEVVLTAAHTLSRINNKPLMVEFDKIRVRVDTFIIHPLYKQNKGADLALLFLTLPIENIKLPALNTSRKELGKIGTSVGFGNFSVANNPKDIVESGRLKSAGQNILDSIAGIPLTNNQQPFLYADFDNPSSGHLNKSGDSMALSLEYGLDGGDSGGGMFITKKGKEVLAGINAVQNKNIAEILKTGTFYGSSSEWVRVSVFQKWIKKNVKIRSKEIID